MNSTVLVKVGPYRSIIGELIAHYGKARGLSHARICVKTYEKIVDENTTHIQKRSAQNIMNAWKRIAPYNQPDGLRISKWYLNKLSQSDAQFAKKNLFRGRLFKRCVEDSAQADL